MNAGSTGHIEELVSVEHKAVHDSKLEYTLTNDMLGHLHSTMGIDCKLVSPKVSKPKWGQFFGRQHKLCLRQAQTSCRAVGKHVANACVDNASSTALKSPQHCRL